MKTLACAVLLVFLIGTSPTYAQLIQGGDGGGGSGVASSIIGSSTLPAEPCTINQVYAEEVLGVATLYFCPDGTWQEVGSTEADTLDTVFDRGKTIDSANSFSNSVRILDANGDGIAIYNDATDGSKIVCVDNNVENACTSYTRQLASGQTVVYKNSGGTAIFTLTESTGALTNVTLDCEATGNTCTITDIKWFDAAACQAGTAQLIWNVPSSNAPAAACDTDSTPNAYASFDATTDESFDFDFVLPPGFTGVIDAHYIWKAGATSGAVGWCMQLVRVPDATTSGQSHAAQSSSNCVSDTAKGTTLQENRADKTGITCTSCAAGDRVKGRISRDADGGAVTNDMAGDAHLIQFGYTLRDAK
jgi:hypothetical protein